MGPKEIRLLVDVGVGKKVEAWLSREGYKAKTIRDLDPRMLDIDILEIAVSEKRLLVTMDKDFGELVYKSKLPHSGVLLLRLEDERSSEKIKVLETILLNHSAEIINSFSVYKDGKLRIRKLKNNRLKLVEE